MTLDKRAMWLWFFCLFLVVLAGQSSSAQDISLNSGVVVEKIVQHSEAEKAGIQEGDVLLQWARGDVNGEIRSPFDLSVTEIEQAPRGAVLVAGLRGTERKTWQLGQNRWGIQVRPNLPNGKLTLYREAQDLATAGKLNDAREVWHRTSDQSNNSGTQWVWTWMLFHLAGVQAEAQHWKESDQIYQEALQASTGDGDAVCQIHLAWGKTFVQRNGWEHASEHFAQAMVVEQRTCNGCLVLAIILDELGGLARKQGDLPKAESFYHQALHIREDLAPGSLSIATSLNNLGAIADLRSDVDKAEVFDQHALAIAEQKAPGSLTVAQALGNLGDVAFDRGRLPEAGEYYRRSFDLYETLAPNSLDLAMAFHRLARVAWKRANLAGAEEYLRRALTITERLAPDSLDLSSILRTLGHVMFDKGDVARAEEYYKRSFAIRERLASGSLDVAWSLISLGRVAYQRGDLDKSDEYHHQALAIEERLAPSSLNVAISLINLGLIARLRGDLDKSDEYHHQALAIEERLAPSSLNLASILINLGVVAFQRGDLAKADEYYHQALAIQERLAPGSIDVATSLINLGLVAWQRGDLAKADEYLHQALAIHERSAPSSLNVAITLSNLGLVAWQQADFDRAENYERQALAIFERLAPGSLFVAASLTNLGGDARGRGDLAEAEKDYRQALGIREKLAPVSVDMGGNLNLLAELAESRGDLDEADQCYRRALAIWEKLAPGSNNQADAVAGLASIRNLQGELDAAAQFYAQALDVLENQIARLGGSEDVRAGFRANYRKYYQVYGSLLIQRGDTTTAFQVLERSRARTLLEMIASSHLDIRRGADSVLLQKERNLRENVVAKSDRRMRLLADKRDDEQVKAVEKEISGLTKEYQEVEEQLRSTSPAYASLTQPRPLTAEAVRSLLPGNTLLLEYSLGETRSYVFAITSTSLHNYELPKSGVIEPLAKSLYQSLTERSRIVERETPRERQERLRKADAASQRAAAELSRMVLSPVAAELKTRRLLIVGDGALQYVPFAVLPTPGPSSGQKQRPLVVEHEIAYLPSASVLALLRQEQKERGRDQVRKGVAVFADPVFDTHDSRVGVTPTLTMAAGDVGQQHGPPPMKQLPERRLRFADTLERSAGDANLGQRGEFRFPRLAFTRDEARAILDLVPRRNGLEALGFDASRSAAVSGELRQYRVVHFATHALVDNIHPELSGLVLSLVDAKGEPVDGFLDLEDIYNLDLSADLVVLSACDTALGKELKGEGMIGLTRGFMYAGAPRVVATLWSVNDFATAKLIARFYKAMERDGMKPAQALRQAQLAMWKQHPSSAPYFWAGFVLQGDWE